MSIPIYRSPLDAVRLMVLAADTVDRAVFVYNDPPVRKAGKQAWTDVKRAGSSVGRLGYEMQASWARSRRSGGFRAGHAAQAV